VNFAGLGQWLSASHLKSLVVNEERMRPVGEFPWSWSVIGVSVSDLTLLVGLCDRQEGHPAGKNVCHLSTEVFHSKKCSFTCKTVIKTETSGYATWFTAGSAIGIAHYDVTDDVVTRKL